MQPQPNHAVPKLALSSKSRRTKEQPINALIAQAMANPSLVDFGAGLVDSHTLRPEICAEAAQKILTDGVRGRVALQYEQTLGSAELRRDCLRQLEKLEAK